MCFSIPVKVIDIAGYNATIEGGKVARFEREVKIQKGDYVQLAGDIIVAKLTKTQGLKVRRLIKRLNS